MSIYKDHRTADWHASGTRQAEQAIVETEPQPNQDSARVDQEIGNPAATSRGLVVTVVTSKSPPVLTKRFTVEDGAIKKTAVANLTDGHAEQVELRDLDEFSDLLDRLKPSQALCYGIAEGHPASRIVSQDRQNGSGAITRTRSYFGFRRGPGVMFLDHDPRERLTPQALIATLRAIPALKDAAMLWRPSASYGIAADGTEPITAGQRIYIPVTDAALIPEAGKALTSLLWAAGHGYYAIGRAGQALERCLVDAAVWQPERLDFAAPPMLGEGVTRDAPTSFVDGDGHKLFDLRELLAAADGNVLAAAAEARKHARAAVAGTLAAERTRWVQEQAPILAERRGIDEPHARQVLELAADKRLLTGDYVLLSADGKEVSVGELLDNPSKWHGKRFADPLEPDYSNNDHRIAWANLRGGGRAQIYSHAHGGRRFYLLRPSADIELRKGHRAHIVDRLVDLLRERGELYDYGDDCMLARITEDGRVVRCDQDWMNDHLDRIARFHRIRPTADGPERNEEDAPAWAARRIAAAQYERGLQRLDSVINAPTIRTDGSLLLSPGYDPPTRLLYVSDAPDAVHVCNAPTLDEARAALSVLWHPFRSFPLVDDTDRGVTLAALLTATLRGTLPTAPGFGFDAPSPGTGKTLLAQATGSLVTGMAPPAAPPVAGGDEEMRKRLFATLMQGHRVLLWDNIHEPLGGAALDAFLTARTFFDRTLGKSEALSLPNRLLFLATGNNLRLRGDTCRRVLVARLDAEMEKPYTREFDWCPRAAAEQRRVELVRAALTLVRGCRTSGWTRNYTGRSASFEDWDRLVRETVCWVSTWDHDESRWYADPLLATERAFENDPDANKLAALLHAWREAVGLVPITSADLIARAMPTVLGGASPHPDLLEALLDIAADRRGGVDVRHLGNWIRTHLERRADGLRIVQHTDADSRSRKSKKWALVGKLDRGG